ncbi:conserved protein of unknown function [Pseudodesulfovibrio profundus]|uniref:DUF1722 domain-containing protein n=1 Tax=Pseudodesulfovibrio profundus TaxID=57320 RepID=A0A2C8F6X5_9BACT|nr:DUF523 and DUF1722 domain-containing protein [Pseudodesulfovibrio profundus]SOB58138.1 conserved protein of unknown function [Pseudodesulfovibrio profundus]
MSLPIKIGISACLLGEKVCRDGGHARDLHAAEELAKYVEFVPLCPELACGMGIPREEVRQIDCAGDIRLIGRDSGEDWTQRMDRWCHKVLPDLESEHLDGFILKSDSNSCGLQRATIHSTIGKPARRGTGYFTRKLVEHFPLLPIETASRLTNPIARENFVRRVFILSRWRDMLNKGMQIGNLVDFHTRHKLIIRAHDLKGYRQLCRLLGESSVFNVDEIFDTYATLLFQSLKLKATPRKNADVLMHAISYLKQELDKGDKQDLTAQINAYKARKIPLLIPVTLINHFARKHDKQYLLQQLFFNPDSTELKLLNHL